MNGLQAATILSIVAITLSAVSLGWNVYREIILKPRLKVRAGVRALLHMGVNTAPPVRVIITAVNFGPGNVYCVGVLAKNARLWRILVHRVQRWFIIQESPQFPQKLEPGQKLDVVLTYANNELLGKPITHLGISDSFGRTHWVPRREVKEILKQSRRDSA